jgi:tetratricopeptide (TPR) repeat protein
LPGRAGPDLRRAHQEDGRDLDLKTRPKPYEVSAAIGKLYYGRGRWADARDFFIQAEKAGEPVRTLFLDQRKRVKGALPDAAAAGCRLPSDTGVDKVVEKARSLAAQKQPGPAAACALEALGPALDSTALLGNTLALLGDTRGALAAYERVLQVSPRNAAALYGHGAVTFEVMGDDLAALKAARKELQTSVDIAPSTPQAASARASPSASTRWLPPGREEVRPTARKDSRRGEAGGRGRAPDGRTHGQWSPAATRTHGHRARRGAPAEQGDDGGVPEGRGDARDAGQLRPAHRGRGGKAGGQQVPGRARQLPPGDALPARQRAAAGGVGLGPRRAAAPADGGQRLAGGGHLDPAAVDALGDRLSKAGNKESARALWTKLQASAPDYASRSGMQKKLGGSP